MEKNKTKNTIIIILLCIIFLFIGLIFGIVLNKKLTKNENVPSENNAVIEKQESKLTKEELLTSLVGEWGRCSSSSCYGLIISKNDNSEYTYVPYLMWSDGSMQGIIKEVTKTSTNKLHLTVYYAAFESILSSYPEQTSEVDVDLTEVSSNIIYIDENKYQKITTDRETFFNSIM